MTIVLANSSNVTVGAVVDNYIKLQISNPDSNISNESIKKLKSLKAKGFLLLIAKTGGKGSLFEAFEKEFIKNKLTFDDLGFTNVNVFSYKAIKTFSFKKMIYQIINNKKIPEDKKVISVYLLIQRGDVNLNDLNLSINFKKDLEKKAEIINRYAHKKAKKMLKTKKSIVSKKFVDAFLKNLELINFNKNNSSDESFFKATYLYHRIIQKEDLGIEKNLLKKFYDTLKAGNVNVAQLPLTL